MIDKTKYTPIGPGKIFYARKSERIKRVKENDKEIQDSLPLKAFYFDGKKLYSTINGKRSQKQVEHIAIVMEPNTKYMGHISPTDGKGITTTNTLLDFFKGKSYGLDNLIGIGSDGPNVNTGNDKGVIFRFEKHLQKSLHYLICLLHMNELLLKNLFVALDGNTRSGQTYAGPIGQSFTNCEELPVVAFKAVSFGDFPENFDHERLTNDQLHLFMLASAISRGYCSHITNRTDT